MRVKRPHGSVPAASKSPAQRAAPTPIKQGRAPAGDVFETARPRPPLPPGSWVDPALQLESSPNQARVQKALEALGKLIVASDGLFTKQMMDDLVRAIAEPRGADPAAAEGVLGLHQALDAARTMVDLQPPRREAVVALLGQVGSQAPELERALLQKALAAHRSEVLAADPAAAQAALDRLTAFAAEIRGKSAQELIDGTSVVDLTDDGKPQGLQQRFVMSCVPTSMQIVKAEADPIAAWAMHKEGAFGLNPDGEIGKEQRAILEAGGGIAEPRLTGGGGQGMWPEKKINDVLPQATNATYVRHDVSTPEQRQAALEHVRDLLEGGYDVPLVAGPSTNHCMVFTDVRPDPAGGSRFLMQDPWTGTFSWMRERDMVAGNVRFSEMEWSNLWITYDASPMLPEPKPGPTPSPEPTPTPTPNLNPSPEPTPTPNPNPTPTPDPTPEPTPTPTPDPNTPEPAPSPSPQPPNT